MADFLHLIVALPLLSAALLGLLGRRLGRDATAALACLAVFSSFFTAHLAYAELVEGGKPLEQYLFRWFSVDGFEVNCALYFDRLSAVMALVVTGVGFLIHVYSAGYMHEDPGHARYFACLNLFTFFMLLLVLGKSLPLLFVGWEGVGLCSYLLIGFWFEDPEKAAAGKKAFIVNRVGDVGFVAGMLLLALEVERATGRLTLDFVEMRGALAFLGDPENAVRVLGATTVAWALSLLFLGATGKSAQIPLYVWLPDAMAGPTPVSALIHAATMVTAGVYMVARLSPFYLLVPNVLAAIAWVGALTALFAATIAVAQTDIKKVLAWSTISQLGYMFAGLGVGAFGAGVYHLVTHAFFKGLLFLAAGSVIHALAGEQDIRRMGGLMRRIPATFGLFAAGWFAICALPPGSGFFSKDAILHAALCSANGGPLLFAVGLLTGGLTAFYMSRLLFLAFVAPEAKGGASAHAHESPAVMLVPMGVLALPALAGGGFDVPGFIAPSLVGAPVPETLHVPAAYVAAASALSALAGIALAWYLYLARPALAASLRKQLAWLQELAASGYGVDALYRALFAGGAVRAGRAIERRADGALIDGAAAHGLARMSLAAGAALRTLQSGLVPDSLLALFTGALVVLWLALR